MSTQAMKNTTSAFLLFASLCSAAAHAEPKDYSCEVVKNTVEHSLDVTLDGDRLTEWTYAAATPGGDNSTTCLVDSAHGKETDSPSLQSYITPAGEITVTKKGKSFVFDFSHLRITDVCGQSSAMAKHITITPGAKRCTNVANAT
ncbi:hypothetical protein [Paraburkholderia sp. J67]|uniref:hypothetical protein n=1 Tax=Paraburkholderia sp. J67 TaxID=2805435 RepID=UPI002ABE133C|nr:hypothetical protein [Paraburkholderia sp. J67]